MNSIWNKNFSAFKLRFPKLAEEIENQKKNIDFLVPQWNLVPAKNGQISCTENNMRLHSAYNPQKEAQSAVNSKAVSDKSITVFYGFGLGYHLQEWAASYCSSGKKLVIIEPDINRFLASMVLLDWTEIFRIPELVLAVACPEQNILHLIENSSAVNIGNTGVSDAFYFDIPSFTQHASGYFDTVRTIIKRNIRKNEINSATLKKFGKLWCRNSIRNLQKISELGAVNVFKKKVQADLPFLIIGAGPSLEKILPHLQIIQKRCVIVCVETALRALLKNHLEPDFIILTDPQFWAYKHIAGLSSPSSVLITEITVCPSVFRFDCKKILLCNSQFPIGQYFQKKMNYEPGDLGTGGSVASSAWNFAFYCGAKRIYTVGLDFAFPGKQTHIKGSSAEQTYHIISNRLSGSDKFTTESLYSANGVMSKDYKGNPVMTDSRMKMFSWWFESRLAVCKDTSTFTLSPEGLNTPGIKIETLAEFLKLPEIMKEKMIFMNNLNNAKKISPVQNLILEELKKSFPQTDFLQEFSFLQPYL